MLRAPLKARLARRTRPPSPGIPGEAGVRLLSPHRMGFNLPEEPFSGSISFTAGPVSPDPGRGGRRSGEALYANCDKRAATTGHLASSRAIISPVTQQFRKVRS